MKPTGYVLITGGFLAAAFFAVRTEEGIALAPFLLALAGGAAGVALVRIALRREASHEDTLAANTAAVESSLVALVREVGALEAEKDGIDVYDLRHHIDQRFPAHLDAFVQARKSIAVTYGLQAYADVMSPFAAGERHLNRVWSASTDGYIDEAHAYLGHAREQLGDALEMFRRLQGQEPAGAPAS